MKYLSSLLLVLAALSSCKDPEIYFTDIIKKHGFIAYKTPLDSVGSGTIIKGKAENLIVYANPERCLPTKYKDGRETLIRWQGHTDLPQELREFNLDFSSNLTFFGQNGNPLFKFKSGFDMVKKIDVKFEGAKIEFIDELSFWEYYFSEMPASCKNALLNYPVFWKALKIEKMKFTFKNSANGIIQISAEKINDMIDFSSEAKWTINHEYSLIIDSPKHIGFLAAQVDSKAVANENVHLFSNKLKGDGNFQWEDVALGGSLDSMPTSQITPIEADVNSAPTQSETKELE